MHLKGRFGEPVRGFYCRLAPLQASGAQSGKKLTPMLLAVTPVG